MTGVSVNPGAANAAQRSRVTRLTVRFDSLVTFAGAVVDAFTDWVSYIALAAIATIVLVAL